jgi:hypothetical protein
MPGKLVAPAGTTAVETATALRPEVAEPPVEVSRMPLEMAVVPGIRVRRSKPYMESTE